MAVLKYIGQQPTSFRDAVLPSGALVRVGWVEPDQEFSVPDEVAESFTRRADVIEAPTDPAPVKAAKGAAKAPAEAPVSDAQPKPSEAAETPSPAAE